MKPSSFEEKPDHDNVTLSPDRVPKSSSAMDTDLFTSAIVPQTDDPSTPTFTVRSVVLGVVFAVLLSFANTIFAFRTNAFICTPSISVLLSYPIGVVWSLLPKSALLNPGPFSIKEHIIVWVIASSASSALAYGVDNVVGQHMFLNDPSATFWPSLAFVLSTQLIGYGLAGLTRRFLVKPAAMLWPANLAQIALFRVFHVLEDDAVQDLSTKKKEMPRYVFFWISALVIFIWEFFPLYFMTTLQLVSVLCFFSSSKVITVLGSGNPFEGVGILSFTLDWSSVTAWNYPLLAPYWTSCNFFASNVIWLWIIVPILYYTNPFGLPVLANESGFHFRDDGSPMAAINTAHLFNKNGEVRTAKSFVDMRSLSLDQSFYDANQPIYISNAFAMSYFTSFINIAAVLSHVFLWYGADIYRRFKDAIHQTQSNEEDIHAQLMKAYPDIPEWMFLIYAASMLVIQIFILQYTSFRLEWWGTLLAFTIAIVFIIPIGAIQALSNQQIGLNVLTEFVIGLMIPGRIVEVMTFKSFGYNIMIQALNLSSDLKLSHYMHISPIAMVGAQFIGTVIGAFMNTGIAFWMMDTMLPLLQKSDSQNWEASNFNVFISAGSIWGAIGPARFFGIGSPYVSLLSGFPIGLVLPFLPWLANKYFPSKYWEYINFPLLTMFNVVPGNLGQILSNFVLATIFQYFIFTYRYDWWRKFNYTLSVALDTGTTLAALVVAFLVFGGINFPTYVLNPSTTSDFYCFAEGWNNAGN